MVNQAHLTGSVASPVVLSHYVKDERMHSFRLTVKRQNETSDTLPILISERDIFPSKEIMVGMKLSIAGQIRTYNKPCEGQKRNELSINIFTHHYTIEISDAPVRNEIILQGVVCKPPIYRTTPFGREICDLLLAVNRSYNKSDYIPCITWGRNARFGSKLSVGDNIKLWGRMQSRIYQKKLETGEVIEKTAYEVSVSKLEEFNCSPKHKN